MVRNKRFIISNIIVFIFIFGQIESSRASYTIDRADFVELFPQDSLISSGKKIYIKYCIMCHNTNTKLLGSSVNNFMKKRDKEWLVEFIGNSKNLREIRKDTVAIRIYKERKEDHLFNKYLSNRKINDLLDYFESIGNVSK